MGKIKAIIVLGFLLATVPFWSIPRSGKEWLMILGGVLIAILGILFQRKFHILEMSPGEIKKNTFTESNTPHKIV